ncbi:hypothetical protein NFJ02_28g64740 [Pycnococcus provasolii]
MCANLPLMSAVTAVLLLTQIPFDTAAAMRTATEEMALGALPRNAKSTTTSFCSILLDERVGVMYPGKVDVDRTTLATTWYGAIRSLPAGSEE